MSSMFVPIPTRSGHAPIPLDGTAPRTLGRRDALGLWDDLGISLLLPVSVLRARTSR